jgi:hypothetical protein
MAWNKMKSWMEVKNGEGLLGTDTDTKYNPVWSSSTSGHPGGTGLEPMRHERAVGERYAG